MTLGNKSGDTLGLTLSQLLRPRPGKGCVLGKISVCARLQRERGRNLTIGFATSNDLLLGCRAQAP